ncbi:MAG: response regulator [Chitinispirillales bacterium]|jgi:DNA-binding response OmpR family regulator|nr:response regulator [Chitinispirillales bacterium]
MKKTILLVDDNQDTLDILEIFLYKDYEIITALNGFEGLKKAENEAPDLIMTDITMPVMDGIRFFNQINKNESAKQTPVIAVTSFDHDITTNSLLSMGFCAVVSKPFEKQTIIAAVSSALSGHKHQTAGRQKISDE